MKSHAQTPSPLATHLLDFENKLLWTILRFLTVPTAVCGQIDVDEPPSRGLTRMLACKCREIKALVGPAIGEVLPVTSGIIISTPVLLSDIFAKLSSPEEDLHRVPARLERVGAFQPFIPNLPHAAYEHDEGTRVYMNLRDILLVSWCKQGERRMR